MQKEILSLKEALNKKLPGIEAQKMLMPEGRVMFNQNVKQNDASVLILVYPDIKKTNSIVLIKRTVYNGHHSGQISFPGGKHEPPDTTFEMTALRESEEEIGVNQAEIEIIGKLTDLYIPVSNFLVHPYVGYSKNTPLFSVEKNEVDYIIECRLNELISLDIKNKDQILFNQKHTIPYFEIKHEFVWGATSMILNEFIQILKKSTIL